MPKAPGRVSGTDRNLPAAVAATGANLAPLDHSVRGVKMGAPVDQDHSKARAYAGDRKRKYRIKGGGVGKRQS